MFTPTVLPERRRGCGGADVVDDATQRREAGARDEALGVRRYHDRGDRRGVVGDVQPHDGVARAAGPAEANTATSLGGDEREGGTCPDDLVPGAGCGEEDDDAEGDEDAEQQGGPRVEAPQHCAQELHFTGLNEVAMPIIRSLDSWLSSVLITQYSVLLRFQATMWRALPW